MCFVPVRRVFVRAEPTSDFVFQMILMPLIPLCVPPLSCSRFQLTLCDYKLISHNLRSPNTVVAPHTDSLSAEIGLKPQDRLSEILFVYLSIFVWSEGNVHISSHPTARQSIECGSEWAGGSANHRSVSSTQSASKTHSGLNYHIILLVIISSGPQRSNYF